MGERRGERLKPEPVHAQDAGTLRELETIGQSLRSIERELENGAISRALEEIAREIDTESVTGAVRSIDRAVDRIENGRCGNRTIC